MNKVFYLGSDHGGLELKDYLKTYLQNSGFQVFDLGTNSLESCDYPIFAQNVGEKVRECDAS
ncbi:MAG: RpiB/LacA/LacB family sugar-phosphate isomerase [Candidatus Diapherotrites archaeon]|nr:RpiB/LacA/LacB family sugar-phosphate isomerase [Candidatus Diapherotrites archaeon]